MTVPPTQKRPLFHSHFSLLAASALALCLHLSPANATFARDARASLQGLRPAGEMTVPTLRDRVVQAGLQAIGTPYRWGGDDPEDGFDCSGLVSFVYREIAGLELPRTARSQNASGRRVDRHQLQAGDLVFFKGTVAPSRNARAHNGRHGAARATTVSHVGIYIGQNQFVHAPTRGETVRIDSLDKDYWAKRYAGARRYLENVTERVASAGEP